MFLAKEYQFKCKRCEGIFTTQDTQQPICRGCWRFTGLTREQIIDRFGKPNPTPLTAAKWRKARKAMEELK